MGSGKDLLGPSLPPFQEAPKSTLEGHDACTSVPQPSLAHSHAALSLAQARCQASHMLTVQARFPTAL